MIGIGMMGRIRIAALAALLVGLRCYNFVVDFASFHLASLSSSSVGNEATFLAHHTNQTQMHDSQSHSPSREFRVPEFKVHSPCVEIQSSPNYNASAISEKARRFQLSRLDTWTLRSGESDGGGGQYYILQFDLMECPPQYMASTFHIQSTTKQSVFSGKIGPRYKIEEGCGYYSASVPVPVIHGNTTDVAHCGGNGTAITSSSSSIVAIEAFWTSSYRNHANRPQDIRMAEQIKAKKDNLTSDEIASMLGEDRLEYLARHLDVLPGFPVALELPADNIILSSKQNSNGTDITNAILPNCSEVPLAYWLPVGISSKSSVDDDNAPWRFQSQNCHYTKWTRDDLNYWLAGLRIRYLGDSHGQFENNKVFETVCPEAGDRKQFQKDRYDCPQQPNNTFAFGWRFYRGVLSNGGWLKDQDGLSYTMRNVKSQACTRFLGLGVSNVTIITTPTWLFVYETEEGLNDYVQSLRDIIHLCHRLHPSEMKNLVLLLQSPTASDVFPDTKKAPSDEWRQNHNFRQEAFTQQLYSKLSSLVDGIIPVFEWTLAQNWKHRTSDGVHQRGTYYEEVFHLQTAAIISALKFSKGWDVPLMSQNDPQARWFIDVPWP